MCSGEVVFVYQSSCFTWETMEWIVVGIGFGSLYRKLFVETNWCFLSVKYKTVRYVTRSQTFSFIVSV